MIIMEKGLFLYADFEEARKLFGGRKRGYETEFQVYKKHKDWTQCLVILPDAVRAEIDWRQLAKKAGMFVPPWKNFQTWLNQRCWEQEFEEIENATDSKKEHEKRTDDRNAHAREILDV